LQIAAIDVAVGPDGLDGEDDSQAITLLSPTGKGFYMRLEKITLTAAPYVVSIQEAIDMNLRIRQNPGLQSVPGVVTERSFIGEKNITRLETMVMNQGMLDHQLVSDLMTEMVRTSGLTSMQFLSQLLEHKRLPKDLKKLLSLEQMGVHEALQEWRRNGGRWKNDAPLSLPRNGTEVALQKYANVKQHQTKLDILTAAYLNLHED